MFKYLNLQKRNENSGNKKVNKMEISDNMQFIHAHLRVVDDIPPIW